MTKKRANAELPADVTLEQPSTGGSFVRNADGSLTRVEHPPEADEPEPATPEPEPVTPPTAQE